MAGSTLSSYCSCADGRVRPLCPFCRIHKEARRETAREILVNGPLAKRKDVEPLVRAERERFGLED